MKSWEPSKNLRQALAVLSKALSLNRWLLSITENQESTIGLNGLDSDTPTPHETAP